MTRRAIVIAVGALLIGTAIAGGLTLIGDQSEPTRTPQDNRAAADERAPEAEDHGVGDLPEVEDAARRFLASYLPLIYGKPGATVDELRSASPRLIAALRAEGGHATPAQAERTPRLQRVTVIKKGTFNALATAQIRDSPSPAYPLVFHLNNASDGWVVTRIGGP
jgi:hypothetical protein